MKIPPPLPSSPLPNCSRVNCFGLLFKLPQPSLGTFLISCFPCTRNMNWTCSGFSQKYRNSKNDFSLVFSLAPISFVVTPFDANSTCSGFSQKYRNSKNDFSLVFSLVPISFVVTPFNANSTCSCFS